MYGRARSAAITFFPVMWHLTSVPDYLFDLMKKGLWL